MTFVTKIAWAGAIGLMLGGLNVAITFAEEPTRTKTAKEGGTQTKQAAEAGDDAALNRREGGRAEARRGERRGGHLVSQYTKLRDEMREKLELSAAQQQKLDGLFEAQLDSLRNKAKGEEGAGDADPRAELKALRDRMKYARAAGDDEAVNQIREELRKKNQDLEKNRADGKQEFLDSLKNELNDSQKEKFQEIVNQLRLNAGARSEGAELGRLMRAIRDPKVNASDEQMRKITDAMREGFSRTGGEGDSRAAADPKKIDESIQRVRERVMKELTEDQRKAVDEILANPDPRGDTRRDGPREVRRGRNAETKEDASNKESDDE